MKLIQDLREFLELLNLENVQYLVIGGWALNKYTEPRFTGDIDLFVSDDPENQAKIRRVLIKFGYETVLPAPNLPLFAKKIIMLGRPPNRIDLLRDISGISFAEAYKNRESGLLDGIPVNFISKHDLRKNKLASGRDKDILDAKKLQ